MEKKLYREAVLEVVNIIGADIVTASADSIIDVGSDPNKDAGYDNVVGGDSSWDA